MDDATSSHPATERFISFSKQAKSASSFDDLLTEFYTPENQKRIPSLLGWARLVYSSPYETLKDGDCESIKLTTIAARVQIDCIGRTIVPSMILGDRELPVHLRVFMVETQNTWYLDRSGYVYVDANQYLTSYGRAGIKFKSELEQH